MIKSFKIFKRPNKKNSLLFFIAIFCTNILAQNYASPLNIPLILSGNCGELRNNHFHSGLDIKTQGVEKKTVQAIADGYISRISVSPSGYGLALYIDHPTTGHTSVYGHLNSFAPQIAQYVKEQQYKEENYKINIYLQPDLFPVKKGQLIAYSGNSGGSAGPHLHFEIRETKTQRILDPLKFYKAMIVDTIVPEVRALAVYPIAEKGIVNRSSSPLMQVVSKSKKGEYLPLKTSIEAWGTIGLGLKAYDKMSNVTNIYGVKLVELQVDGKEIFKSDIESYSFDQTRMINTFADFATWRNKKEWYMKSFVEEGNQLPFYSSTNNGYININEERTYNVQYQLTDIYGNNTSYNFSITGKKQTIPSDDQYLSYMPWNKKNYYSNKTFSLEIDKGNLYSDLRFTLRQSKSGTYLSDRYLVNTTPVPLDDKASIKIKLTNDTLNNKKQYGIVQIRKGRDLWLGGTYDKGSVTSTIRELGCEYAVYLDTVAPTIEPISPERWAAQKAIKVRINDNMSGMSSFRALIDGKFALFTHDMKSPVYTYIFDEDKLEKDCFHELIFTATDACENQTIYQYEFYY